MGGEQRRRLLARLLQGTPEFDMKRLCEVGAEVAGVSGAGIMLLSDDVPQGSLGTTNQVSALIAETQFALGEGPSVDAYHQDQPISEPDLENPGTPRWLAFTGRALGAGVCAAFAFPLHLGAVRLGTLDLYRDRPGPLTDEQHADALAMADLATRTVLVMQANAPNAQLAAELDDGADFQYVVHQASGMVAAQLDLSVGQALVRLRAYAFGNDRPLTQVAEDVVARELRFDEGRGEHNPWP